MDQQAQESPAAAFGTRDLATFNRWLCVTRLRASGAVTVFVVALHYCDIGGVAVGPVMGVCAFLAVVSAVGLGFGDVMAPSLVFLIAQTLTDLGAITVGIALSASGVPALLFRPLFAMVVVPSSLISAPVGIGAAVVATASHLGLLGFEHGWSSATFLTFEALVPPFLFFLLAQQSFFYGDHIALKNTALAGLADRLRESQEQLAIEGRVSAELVDTAHLLSATLDAPDPLAAVSRTIRERIWADWCAIFVVGDSGTFELRATSDAGVPEGELGRVAFPLASWPILERVAREHLLVLTGSDATQLPAAFGGGRAFTTVLLAALYRDGRMIGLITVGYTDTLIGNEDWAAHLFAGIAEHATVVLQNTRLLEEVRAASALKDEFVGAVSHELRSPLNVILGYLEMTLDRELGALSAEQVDALGRTQRQAVILLEMITALLDLNRFEAGRLPIERAPVAVGSLLGEVMDQLPETWRRCGVALELLSAEGLPMIETDAGKLKTVVRNLLHNALKFTTAGRVSLLAALTPDGEIAITVADTGCGIPPDAIHYVFDMFRQAPGAHGGGVGLGLHIVRRFVEALGGRVTVASDVGRGTRFTVCLPTVAPLASEAEAA